MKPQFFEKHKSNLNKVSNMGVPSYVNNKFRYDEYQYKQMLC